jgi:hypothetical protein
MQLIYSNEETLILTVAPEHTDAFIPSWYELKYSIAVQPGPCIRYDSRLALVTSSLLRNWRPPVFCFSGPHKRSVTRYDPSERKKERKKNQQQHNPALRTSGTRFFLIISLGTSKKYILRFGPLNTIIRKWKWFFVNGCKCKNPIPKATELLN